MPRLKLIVQNRRFLLLTAKGQAPNLASHVLGAAVRVLPAQWHITEGGLPLSGQHTHGGPQDVRGQVGGLALGGQQEETAVLHNEFEPGHPLGHAPANPQIPVFEGVTSRPPNEQGDPLALEFDDLAQIIAHRLAGSQIMVLAQLRVERLELLFPGHSHRQPGAVNPASRCIENVFHPNASDQKTGPVSSLNFCPAAAATYIHKTKDPDRHPFFTNNPIDLPHKGIMLAPK